MRGFHFYAFGPGGYGPGDWGPGGWGPGGWGPRGGGGCGCGPRGHRHRPSLEDHIAFLERYQRDLEQEVADVAERLRRLRQLQAGEPRQGESA